MKSRGRGIGSADASREFLKQKFSPATTNNPEEGTSSGRPEPRKAKWGTIKVPEKSIYKDGVAELKALGVKTQFLYMTTVDKNHLESMVEGPLLHNEGQAGKLICFSLIFY